MGLPVCFVDGLSKMQGSLETTITEIEMVHHGE